MSEPIRRLDPLDILATEFTVRHRQGECPTIREYIERYPELEDDICALFPTIAALERQKVHRQRTSEGRVQLAGRQLERLGDFQIVRELGRGGMGVVFEAEQQSLKRRVAIKVLPRQSLMDRRQLQRFQREALVAASLHHTNIVQVFGVGEEDGYHYIVMQLVAGSGLDRVVAELMDSLSEAPPQPEDRVGDSALRTTEAAVAARALLTSKIVPSVKVPEATRPASCDSDHDHEPAGTSRFPTIGQTYWSNVARIGVQVAEALAHAHQRGVMHRDIKPANLLVDHRGVVWVTDFGMAKAVEDDAVSRTGDIVGTLQYMAPEQLQGQADARSDIYSLGMTLYEMLALRPAFDGRDANALMRKILQETPPHLSSVAAGSPRDLITIVMKAIAREPEHRYPSAEEMADELQRFVDGRPIHSRPISRAERIWRWCRRNPTMAALSATALLLLALVAVVSSVGYIRTSRALAGQSEQRRKADTTAQLATQALDDIFIQFAPARASELSTLTDGDTQISARPAMSKEAAALLERLLGYYDRLAAQVNGETSFERKRADAKRRIGDIHTALGQYDEAEVAYHSAIHIYGLMRDVAPNDGESTLEIARIYNNLGESQIPAGTPESSRTYHLKALATLENLSTTETASAPVRYETARTCYLLAQNSGRPGPSPQAPPPPVGPTPPPRPAGAARSGSPPPRPPAHSGQLPPPGHPDTPPLASHELTNEVALSRAIKLLEQLTREEPSRAAYRHTLACCYRQLAAADPTLADSTRVDYSKRAIEILEELVERFPAVPAYQVDLVKTFLSVRVPGDPHPYSVTRTRLSKALDVAAQLVAEHPNVPDYVQLQVQVYLTLAELLQRDQHADDAIPLLREARRLESSLVARYPSVMPHQIWMAMIDNRLAETLLDRNAPKEACELLQSAITALSALPPDSEHGRPLQELLAQSYGNLATAYRHLGQVELADKASRQAEQHRTPNKPLPRPPL